MVPLQQQCQFWSKDGSGEATEVLLQFFMRAKSGETEALLAPCEMQGGCLQSTRLKDTFFSCCSVVHHLSSLLAQALRTWGLAYSWCSFRDPLRALFGHYTALCCCVNLHSYLGGGNASWGSLEERLGHCGAPQLWPTSRHFAFGWWAGAPLTIRFRNAKWGLPTAESFMNQVLHGWYSAPCLLLISMLLFSSNTD